LNDLNPEGKAEAVRELFSQIAPRYDLMNRLMTVGQDIRWRKEVVRRANLPPQGRLMDLGAGTGDLALEACRQGPTSSVTAADFTLEMMRIGKARTRRAGACPERLAWSAADALHLPFASGSFDAVVSGFLMRNVSDVRRSLKEQVRVIKPGGRLIILDTTRPRRSLFSPLVQLHLHFVIPTLGGLVSGHPEAYRYLPESTAGFLEAEQLAGRMAEAGLKEVGFKILMFGTTAIHWGVK
jgi:demethylmenaquinone methyltransferase / 2-methoxy-6-polyprenyl-1,4-benzoquinol methylase